MSRRTRSRKGFTGTRVAAIETCWLQDGCTDRQKAQTAHTSKPKKLTLMAAALQVLQSSRLPMTCTEMIDVLAKKGMWVSPAGKTPVSTLYAALSRSIKDMGKASPYRRTERGEV